MEAKTGLQRRSIPGAGEFSPGRVLVIGNDDEVRDVLAILATIEGCETQAAHDGPEAVDAIARWNPDLLLIDLEGVAGGPGSIRTFRDVAGARVPIVILSDDPRRNVELSAMPGVHWLSKPFAVGDLLQLLDELVDCS